MSSAATGVTENLDVRCAWIGYQETIGPVGHLGLIPGGLCALESHSCGHRCLTGDLRQGRRFGGVHLPRPRLRSLFDLSPETGLQPARHNLYVEWRTHESMEWPRLIIRSNPSVTRWAASREGREQGQPHAAWPCPTYRREKRRHYMVRTVQSQALPLVLSSAWCAHTSARARRQHRQSGSHQQDCLRLRHGAGVNRNG